MTIKSIKELQKELQKGKLKIDLTGPNGNAFYLLGLAKKLSIQFGNNEKEIMDKMMSSNYKNLVKVFDEEFGDYVDLYR